MNALDALTTLFATDGTQEYFGEPVTQATHMLQAATIALDRGLHEEVITAALVHDVGHFRGALRGSDLVAGTDNHHAEVGAIWLSQWFGPEVTEPVRLHVEAKRYLCVTEPGYFATLSPASVDSLRIQGGPMDDAERAAFERLPGCAVAIAVRRCDDAAKSPERATYPLERFLDGLGRLVRPRP